MKIGIHSIASVLTAVLVFFAFFRADAATISELKFEQSGGVALPERTFELSVQQKKGVEYDPRQVNKDIKRLYETGDFDDVVSEVVPLADGGVALTYKLRFRPRVKEIEIVGNAKFKTEKLMEMVTVPLDAPLNAARELDSAKAIQDYYKEKGYNEAVVTTKTESVSKEDNTVKVIFNIVENLRKKVDNVTFEGNTVYSAFKLRHSIANSYNWFGRFFEIGLYNAEELSLDKDRLRELYWEKGYLDFEIKELMVTPDEKDPEYVNIHFVFDEGEPYKVGKTAIVNNTIFAVGDMMPYVLLKEGATFRFADERATIEALSALYEQLGYADINVSARRIPDFETHSVDVTFEVNEGRRYTIRHVEITGNVITKDKVIRRELATQPGDPVDRNRIEASKARLLGMGYFSKVETAVTNADALDEKDVTYRVEEKDNYSFRIGGGFSDVNSLFGLVEFSNNNFDLLNPRDWFSGGGQRLRVQGLFGIERMGFNVDFSEPWLFDLPLRLDLSGYMNRLTYSNWTEDRIGVRAGLTRKVFDDFTNVTVGYKFEHVNVNDMNFFVAPETKLDEGGQYVSQFSLMFDRDTRDSLTEPTSGYHLNFLGAVSPKIFASSENFYRLEAKGSIHYSFWDKAIVTMLGAKFGTVAGFSRDDDVPIFERYFMGGGDSLRGFPFREVSPLDSHGFQRGGQSMMLVTAEVSHPIWNFIRGAVFMDLGNVWEKSYTLGSVNMGVGYGLRIKVPYLNAPIKLDLAYPVINNQPGLESKLRFHFNMGFTW